MTALPSFPTFNLEEPDLRKSWGKYVSRLENLLLAMNITNAARKKAMLLHYVGEEVNEIFETLEIDEPDREEDVFRKAEKALRNYFTPQKNIEFEVYKFRQAKQLPGENISAYYTRLKQLAKSCEFHEQSKEIKTQIIQNGSSSKLWRKALADPEITMEKLIQMGKTMEMSKTQAEGIESTNRIWHKRKQFKTPTEKTSNAFEYSSKIKCKFCACEHRPGKTSCPAYGKKCRQCLKWNHFKVCCYENRRGKELMQDNYQSSRAESTKRNGQIKRNQVRPRQVNAVQEITSESSMEDEYVFSTLTAQQKLPKFKVKINGTPVSVMADTGSSVNLLDEVNFNKLKKKPILQEANEKIFPYGSKKQLN
ncbi:uncharacterized protein LOC124452206 [Xenia sp. Carnegie-2017]|uniref:uncharacterized protein LOC124452206 n=1 Tax=Xenia sp. Carnegie-2017 TaxID=2897299 RepID=UPI001F03B291|nr:uncharacterized protein LOC124452206 [Xenia sp. Carnegie-2017]